MSDEIEYIEPTQEHVGQMVDVRHAEMATHRQRTLLAVLPHPIKYRFVCQDSVDAVSSSHWQYARIPRPLTYAERQSKCGLKVWDKVRVMTLPEAGQYGWKAGVSGGMRHLVGTVRRIEYMDTEYGFTVGGYCFPYFVLEKVEDRVATRRDIDATVYVDGNPKDEFTFEHWYDHDNQPCRAVVRSGDRRFVYELSNLRVKE